MTGGGPVRNILVVLTDGYINFDSVRGRPRKGWLTSWMEVARLRHTNWEEAFAEGRAGMLPAGTDHGAWEVLVLEAAPKTPKDMPLVRTYWEQWLTSMGISHFRMEQRDDSTFTARDALERFLKEHRPDRTVALTR